MNAWASSLHLIHAPLDLFYMFSGFAVSVSTSLEHDTRNMITFSVLLSCPSNRYYLKK